MFAFRAAAALAGFIAAGTYGLAIALARRDRSRVAHDYSRMLARLTHRALGIELRVSGAERLDAYRPCIFIANHQSNLDIPLFAAILPERTVVVAKKEISRIPFIGWLAAHTGNLLIDRSDQAQAVGQLQEAAAEIRRRGVSVWVFPEGTRGRQPGRLLPFKKGAFRLAIAAQVPLVPIVMEPLRPRLDVRKGRVRPGPIDVWVLEPIHVEGIGEEALTTLIGIAEARMTSALAAMSEAASADP